MNSFSTTFPLTHPTLATAAPYPFLAHARHSPRRVFAAIFFLTLNNLPPDTSVLPYLLWGRYLLNVDFYFSYFYGLPNKLKTQQVKQPPFY